tara:strand:+ start:162 stop:317 length:156 start_codon:yes stop_codon:yes gene_type:complete
MELALRQIIMLIIAITVGLLIILFIMSKVGPDGSINNVIFNLLDTSTEALK